MRRSAPQGDQRDLAGAERPERQDAGANPPAGVAQHVAMTPNATGQVAVALESCRKRPLAGQANLPAVRVSGEIKAVSGGRLAGNLGRMDERDAKPLRRGRQRRRRRLGIKAVDIVEPRDVQQIHAAGERHRLVDEHPQTKLFHGLDHLRAIVVAEDTHDTVGRAHRRDDMTEAIHNRPQRRMDVVANVARDHAEVGIDPRHGIGSGRGSVVDIVEVKVGQVEDPVAIETGRRRLTPESTMALKTLPPSPF